MRWGQRYFAVQAIAGATRWVAVFMSPYVRETTLSGLDPVTVAAFDIPLFVVASAVAACGVRGAAVVSTYCSCGDSVHRNGSGATLGGSASVSGVGWLPRRCSSPGGKRIRHLVGFRDVGLILSSRLVIAYAIAGSLLWNYAIRPFEESDLAERFGDDFRRYRDTVRCWIPRVPRAQPALRG